MKRHWDRRQHRERESFKERRNDLEHKARRQNDLQSKKTKCFSNCCSRKVVYLQSVDQRVLHLKRYQHQRALMKQEKASTSRELFWIKREVSTSGKGLEVIRNSVLVTYDSCTIEEKVYYVPNIAATTAAQNAAA